MNTLELVAPVVETDFTSEDKQVKYDQIYQYIRNTLAEEKDMVANMANITSALHYGLGFLWTGFYIARGHELVLGPFQGTIGCTRIRFGKGVCGQAWAKGMIMNVPNVNEFSGHIVCSAQSQSELVLPIYKGSKIVGVLDIDSDKLSAFDAIDEENLEKIVRVVGKKM